MRSVKVLSHPKLQQFLRDVDDPLMQSTVKTNNNGLSDLPKSCVRRN